MWVKWIEDLPSLGEEKLEEGPYLVLVENVMQEEGPGGHLDMNRIHIKEEGEEGEEGEERKEEEEEDRGTCQGINQKVILLEQNF